MRFNLTRGQSSLLRCLVGFCVGFQYFGMIAIYDIMDFVLRCDIR